MRKRSKRTIVRVQWDEAGEMWLVQSSKQTVRVKRTKVEAVESARFWCHLHAVKSGGGFAQLVVHGKDGRIQFENTYGADPKQRKG